MIYRYACFSLLKIFQLQIHTFLQVCQCKDISFKNWIVRTFCLKLMQLLVSVLNNFWYHVCPCVKTSNLSLNTLKYSLIISIFNNYIAQFDSSNKQLLYTRMNSPNCFSTEKQFGHVLKSFLSVFRFKITCLFWVSKDLLVEAKGVSSSSSIQ